MATVMLSRSSPTPPPSVGRPNSEQIDEPSLLSLSGGEATPIQIPNKHMPCPNPTGVKFTCLATPPASPPDGGQLSDIKNGMDSLLYPPENYACLSNTPPVYAINAAGLAAALNFTSRQPLPAIEQLFPWAHGLHSENALQLSFFYAKKKSARRTPSCYRGICIVKAGSRRTGCTLKGTVLPEEILPSNQQDPGFLCVDPREGFSVRNFHIQVAKFAGISDIVVYGDGEHPDDRAEVMRIAKRISAAQIDFRKQCLGNSSRAFPLYSTFVVESVFSEFEKLFPEFVTVNTKGYITGKVVDFCHWERMEMCSMSKTSEISSNVWLGSTSNPCRTDNGAWNVMILCTDMALMPPPETLDGLLKRLNDQTKETVYLDFPASGTISPLNWSKIDVDGIINVCQWIYMIANGEKTGENHNSEGDQRIKSPSREPCNILIHCGDGYTETSLLALAYTMYSGELSVHEAWITLHSKKKRNFFAYDKDLAFLRYIERALLVAAARQRRKSLPAEYSDCPPPWLYRMDGSLPSRILSYMYLGNLLHANNCGLLQALGIKRVLSIGEEVLWTKDEKKTFGKDNVMTVKDLQDNGCDPLQCQFRRCLDFIDQGHRHDEPVLVHCRVGVSRSATICIAEVMRTLKLSLPRAYCYVRARRLNVIIQPHLRFMYELLKFEESLATRHGRTSKRELEWMHIAREVAIMNRPYTRQN